MIRTAGNPFRSRPSAALMLTGGAVVAIGLILPFTPLAVSFGPVPLPLRFFIYLVLLTLTYLALVELAKPRVMQQWL